MRDARVTREVDGGWTLSRPAAAGRRGPSGPAGAAAVDPLVARLLDTGKVEVASDQVAAPSPRRAAGAPGLTLEVATAPGEAFVLVARHASGAITVHPPQPIGRRGRPGAGVTRFYVPPRLAGGTARRGAVTGAVRVVVLKVLEKPAGWVLQRLARHWEEERLKRSPPGWVTVTPAALLAARDGSAPLSAARPQAFGPRNLLLLHGTLSSTEGCFAKLVPTRGAGGQDFFAWAEKAYGGRIFGFNHLTVSASLEENARSLLAGLPERATRFDVVTHSRGGLVLRTLLERRGELGALAERFELGRAVLVAVPNQGTPLAAAERWDETVGWFANLVDLFPDNPFTFGVEFVAEGLNWIAQRVVGELPGLAAMDPGGEVIAGIQAPPGPPPQAVAALATNFEPGALGARLLDAGIDGFFAGANDLVVPSAGGWLVSEADGGGVPAERIGCYGPGGNLGGDAVHHLNLFGQPATVDFLIHALEGRASGAPPLDPRWPLPYRGRYRGAGAARPAAAPPADRPTRPAPGETGAHPPGAEAEGAPPGAAAAAAPLTAAARSGQVDDRAAWTRDALQLFILARTDEQGDVQDAQLLATYRNARVMAPFAFRSGEAGQRYKRIIDIDRGIRGYVDGDRKAKTLPSGDELREFGELLFTCLFPGEVQRLYDEVRSSHAGGRLDIVLTSMISWLADLPWEFAFDPSRRTFLATEEINFVRNVQTAIPADQVVPRPAPLRVLVVAAQPIGAGTLSAEEEIELVERGFHGLGEAGLITYEVLRQVSPDILHKRLHAAQLAGVPFDVLHFIGHGEYDEASDTGYLLFEDDGGGVWKTDTDALRQILCRRGLRLVFLNACETGQGGRSDFNRGVAPGLVAGGIPAVVGNQYKVLDPSATAFAQHFYWALARGATIGDAAREARVAVNYSISGEAIDWAVPVVFTQSPRERLCQPSGTAEQGAVEARAAAIARAPGRRRAAGRERPVRVGLWDVNHVIPKIREIAERLEAVQTYYSFEIVDLIAPLGTWRLQRRRGDDPQGYLDADQVGQRLKDTPRQLGLDLLFCITTFRVSDKEWWNLYYWDDPESGGKNRIALISFAGLEKAFRPPDLPVERAIANLVAGALAPLESHSREPKNCPFYFNRERDPRWIAGPSRFCAECSRRLRRKVSAEERAAIEALLEAFGGAAPQPGARRAKPTQAKTRQSKKRAAQAARPTRTRRARRPGR